MTISKRPSKKPPSASLAGNGKPVFLKWRLVKSRNFRNMGAVNPDTTPNKMKGSTSIPGISGILTMA
ncbi:hypothetical protein D3C86_2163800 [compost metagenome]